MNGEKKKPSPYFLSMMYYSIFYSLDNFLLWLFPSLPICSSSKFQSSVIQFSLSTLFGLKKPQLLLLCEQLLSFSLGQLSHELHLCISTCLLNISIWVFCHLFRHNWFKIKHIMFLFNDISYIFSYFCHSIALLVAIIHFYLLPVTIHIKYLLHLLENILSCSSFSLPMLVNSL